MQNRFGRFDTTSFQEIMLSSGVFRRETASGFYPWGKVKCPRERVAEGLCGVEKGTYEYESELNDEMELLPKQMIMIVIENEKIDKLLEIVKKELYTGHIGDGKIFVSPISNIIRVRTGEEGNEALK